MTQTYIIITDTNVINRTGVWNHNKISYTLFKSKFELFHVAHRSPKVAEKMDNSPIENPLGLNYLFYSHFIF